MVLAANFIVKFNTRLLKKYENYTLVLITSKRVARLSIYTSDQHLCNEVIFDGFRSHFHSKVQHTAS